MAVTKRANVAEDRKRMPYSDRWDVGADAAVLGQGITGKVFAGEDPGRAVKVCRCCKPYMRFVAFAEGHGNPHLPVIHEVRHGELGRFRKPVRMRVEMERLRPLDPETADWRVINAFANTCHAVAEGRPVADATELDGPLHELASKLGRLARDNNLALDLKCDNIMVRPATGELVFVDPLR